MTTLLFILFSAPTLLQTETPIEVTEVNYIADLVKVGPVVTVLLLVIRFMWLDRKELKKTIEHLENKNDSLQEELKTEIKATTAFAEQIKLFFQQNTNT